jgi:hypothetical protein
LIHTAWRRTFGLEVELEMADDLIDGLGIFDGTNGFSCSRIRVYIETCVVPAENLLYKRKANELFLRRIFRKGKRLE